MKRLLNSTASDIKKMNRQELLQSIKANAGRTVLAEVDVVIEPFAKNLTNAEVVTAFGTDIVLLNCFDFEQPVILGLPEGDNIIEKLKELVGKPVGVNLEPIDLQANHETTLTSVPQGRQALLANILRAEEMGFDFICLTGNPGTGVSNQTIIETVKIARQNFSGMIIAGKMHSAGVHEPIISYEVIDELVENGADIILLPVAGTVPGVSEDEMRKVTQYIQSKNKLVMSAIGTTQEGADPATIRDLALMSKRCGSDIQHIGDAGFNGTADPENIMQLSITIRGKRHTYLKMAQSINR